MDAHKEKILSLYTNNLQDTAMNKAMMAFTKKTEKIYEMYTKHITETNA